MTIVVLKKQIVPILKMQGVTKAGIFGSFATGNQKKNSDVDILVKFKDTPSLLDLSRLKLKLENRVGRKVDILTYDGIYPRLKNIILEEQKVIYEKRS